MAAKDITPAADQAEEEGQEEEGSSASGNTRRSKSDRAADMIDGLIAAGELALVLSSVDEAPHARLAVDGHLELHPLRGGRFARYLRRKFHECENQVLVGEALTAALAHADMRAWDAPRVDIFVRVAPGAGAILIDVADDDWVELEVSAGGVTRRPHTAHFVRSPGMLPLPAPVSKPRKLVTILREEWGYDEDHAVLAAAAIIAMFEPIGTLPVVVIAGEHGSGKSTLSKLIRIAVDPSGVPVGRPPREPRDLNSAPRRSYVLAYDNLGYLPRELSDSLASIATGSGQRSRQLYTDDDEIVSQYRRPSILNGISAPATMPDLLDRALMFELPARDGSGTKTLSEAELSALINAAGAELFSAALVALGEGLRNLASTKVARWHRLTDGVTLALAAAEGAGTTVATMSRVLRENRAAIDDLTLSGSDFAAAVVELGGQGEWTGTVSELLAALVEKTAAGRMGSLRKTWPGSTQGATARMRAIMPILRRRGIEWVDAGRSDGKRKHVLRQEGETHVTHVTASPEAPETASLRGNEGDVGRDEGSDEVQSTSRASSQSGLAENGSVEPNLPPNDEGDESDVLFRPLTETARDGVDPDAEALIAEWDWEHSS